MTLDAFLDRVPWADMVLDEQQQIRSAAPLKCPICAVFGGNNWHAYDEGIRNGLSDNDARLVIVAADSQACAPDAQALRAEMLRRMAVAR